MRFSAVLVVLSAAFATTTAAFLETRQSGYASCALPCLTSSNPGTCALDDTLCLCKDQQFVQETTTCFESSCSGSDLTQSIAAAVAMCRAVGVTLSTSNSGPTSTSSSTPSSTSGSSDSSFPGSSKNSGVANGVNGLFALSALGLIGYAL
ncbi:hypothetical protein BJ322DRAFT_1111888 [Thelephora terrestris]|uniref:CFEM domain-containing protein n=1 Tax=Thelephora terrestris TaxID=56493 RepID=A0A9P6H7J4_9AGAM|nr:hypothetical protein BJ322DRAFT_1111888 [Thelephora terrestris]